ncbi:AEC family transporter [Xenophilus sp. Marseille-Q4582]|uniref:AEC family transporter n=1 Tax=Xenophilus sp. Marseille-Q4582 TaxID=2866600 RepID=UPI001CE41CE1|nr:AEC family transporter [Xenophilus sp. Marseille-Q4582]
MNSLVLSSLLPVVLLIAAGYFTGRQKWVGAAAVKDLSNLIFLLLAPALLFRTMSLVRVEELQFKPVAAYFAASVLIFCASLAWRGFNRTGAVLALANTFSNTVMIGLPLVGLAFGDAGMVVLLTLVSLHSLVLMTGATVVLELATAREQAHAQHAGGAAHGQRRAMLRAVARALRNAIIHPVPLPILAGLLYGQTGWGLPELIDKPLALLGQAFSPLALVMVGITLAWTRVGEHLRGALVQAAVKNLIHPLMVAAIAWLFGVRGLPLAVMVLTAALPIGANVFLFSQRYRSAEALTTASVVVSTLLGLATVSLTLVAVRALI